MEDAELHYERAGKLGKAGSWISAPLDIKPMLAAQLAGEKTSL